MKVGLIVYTFLLIFSVSSFGMNLSNNVHVGLSQQLLEACLNRENSSEFIKSYQEINLDTLEKSLDSDEKQLAFWINTYNAFIQYQLLNDPSLFEDRSSFYKNESINIGGRQFSFDLIEHGIIRNSRWKYGLGYIKKWFSSDLENKFRLKGKDGRVHFALNCGAISCPPVAIYNDEEIDAQFEEVIKYYLPKVTSHDDSTVTTTPLFSWFRGDFNGRAGVKIFLRVYNIIDVGDKNLEYGEYDWTLDLENIYEN